MVRKLKSQSCKQKGRAYQQEVIALIRSIFPELGDNDLVSRSSGSNGEDIIMSPAAVKALSGQYSIECKHRANGLTLVYDSLLQSKAQAKGTPIACLRNNRKKSIVAMYAEDFWQLVRGGK